MAESPAPPNDPIRAALFRGNKIEAIKLHREATGAGLAEAKGHVEQLEAELRAAHPEQFPKPAGKSGCTSVLATLALLFALVACWLVMR